MDTFILGYLLFISTQILRETLFRKGNEAKSVQLGKYDKGTTILNGLYIVIVSFIPLLFKYFNLGFIRTDKFIGYLGIILILFGMVIHFLAIRMLGELFTRTLMITKKHLLIRTGIYSKIRHPGYLGTILIGIGLGLSSSNWMIALMIIILLFLTYPYRIYSEEKMLIKQFGKEYREYKKNSRLLIPYIF